MTLLRFFLLFLAPAWIFAHIVFRRGLRWPWKAVLAVLLFLVTMTHVSHRLFFGSVAGPNMPAWLLVPQVWLYVAMLIVFAIIVCGDLVRLVRWLGRLAGGSARRAMAVDAKNAEPPPAFSPERRSFLKGAAGTVASAAFMPGLALGTSAVGIASGTALPKLREMALSLPDLPPGLNGVRIAHLTDIHIGPLTSAAWARQVVERTNAARPDLICLTGDLTDGRPEYQIPDGNDRKAAMAEFARLSAPLGVFACTGNHEYFSNFMGWMELYSQNGIVVLHNRARLLEKNGAKLAIAGMDDRAATRFGLMAKGSRKEAFASLPEGEGAFLILMDHRPDTAPESAAAGAHLQLSGHTHGGQCLGMDRLVAAFNSGLVRGWYRVHGMPLYVSNGAGLWPGYPVRLGVPAEIALITLERGPARDLPNVEQ